MCHQGEASTTKGEGNNLVTELRTVQDVKVIQHKKLNCWITSQLNRSFSLSLSDWCLVQITMWSKSEQEFSLEGILFKLNLKILKICLLCVIPGSFIGLSDTLQFRIELKQAENMKGVKHVNVIQFGFSSSSFTLSSRWGVLDEHELNMAANSQRSDSYLTVGGAQYIYFFL